MMTRWQAELDGDEQHQILPVNVMAETKSSVGRRIWSKTVQRVIVASLAVATYWLLRTTVLTITSRVTLLVREWLAACNF